MNDKSKTVGFGPAGTVYREMVNDKKASLAQLGELVVSKSINVDINQSDKNSAKIDLGQADVNGGAIIDGLGIAEGFIKADCQVDGLWLDSKLIEGAKLDIEQPTVNFGYEPIKLATNDPMQDYFNDGDGNSWSVARLVEMTADLPIIEVPIQALNISSQPWDGCDMLDLAFHVRNVMDADLDKPIILDWLGRIADGRHRIIKSIIQGKSTIKCVRMYWRPAPDKTA